MRTRVQVPRPDVTVCVINPMAEWKAMRGEACGCLVYRVAYTYTYVHTHKNEHIPTHTYEHKLRHIHHTYVHIPAPTHTYEHIPTPTHTYKHKNSHTHINIYTYS